MEKSTNLVLKGISKIQSFKIKNLLINLIKNEEKAEI